MGGLSSSAKCGLLLFLTALDQLRPKRDFLPILNYHAIDEDRSPTSLPPSQFAIQMDIVAARGIKTVTFGEVVDLLAGPGKLPADRVCLTFDDGLESVYTAAFPLLRQRGFTATVFLTTGTRGNKVDWERDPSIAARSLLDRDQVAALKEGGFEIGGHTRTHPHMTELDDDSLDQEIVGNRDDVTAISGRPPETFAYPYGDVDDRVVAALEGAGYKGACTITPPFRSMGRDLFRVERIDVSRFSSHRGRLGKLSFISCLNGVFADYINIKRTLPFIRKRTFEYKERMRRDESRRR